MPKLTRRDFLKFGSLGIAGLALSRFLVACGQVLQPTASPVPAQPTPTSRPPENPPTEPASPTEAVQQPTEPATATPEPIPDLAVARGGEPEALVRTVLAALGGMGLFVPGGAKVIIKPNICVAYRSYKYAATTNPWVVGALVKLCFEAGAASVQVLDFPFGGTAQEAYRGSGIQEQVEAAGGEMAYMPAFKYVSTPIPNGLDLKKISVFDDIMKADVLINVPVAKHHDLARLTLCMKNLMGVIDNRSIIHINVGQRLADLASLIRPTLNVVDAVRILTDHGPTGGNLDDVKKLDTVIASRDIVAADSYAATLFGLQPDDLPYITAAAAMGLGRSDLQNLVIKEVTAG